MNGNTGLRILSTLVLDRDARVLLILGLALGGSLVVNVTLVIIASPPPAPPDAGPLRKGV